jgi:hypothetical protein
MERKTISIFLVVFLLLSFSSISFGQGNTPPLSVDTLAQEFIRNQIDNIETQFASKFKPVGFPAEDIGLFSMVYAQFILEQINDKKFTVLTALTDVVMNKSIIQNCKKMQANPQINFFSTKGDFLINDKMFNYFVNVEEDCSVDFNAEDMFKDKISLKIQPAELEPLQLSVQLTTHINGKKNKVKYDIVDDGLGNVLISSFKFTTPATEFRYTVPEDIAKKVIDVTLSVMPDPWFDELTLNFCNLPPTVSFLSPSHGISIALGSFVTVSVAAGGCPPEDGDPLLNSVTFFVDDVPIVTDFTNPYGFITRFTSLGHHRLKAVTTNASGLSAEAEVTVTIVLGAP